MACCWTILGNQGAPTAVVGEKGTVPSYLCPELQSGGGSNGVGSNGRFDYMGVYAFSGANADRVPLECEYIEPGSGDTIDAYVPIVLEEDPDEYGGLPGTDPGHAGSDRISSVHQNLTSNYFAVDGSMHIYTGVVDSQGPLPYSWRVKTPSGAIGSLQWVIKPGTTDEAWGAWDTR